MEPKKHLPKLGEWKITRKGDNEIIVKLPEGMKITGEDLVIEDLLAAIANHNANEKGRNVMMRCCAGNLAIA
ncbi:MAG: hypothetical protein P0116_16850 [Candidatus Nitrosocosmicus sp.]|nr:hypothetical protein [Candidatus Nitrosocosmicus sp.]